MMKKVLRNSLSIILATTALGLTACGETGAGPLPPYDDAAYTDYVLAEAGKTDYSIVVGMDADQFEKFAAEELQNLFKEATGATMPFKTEDQVSYSEDAKVISIGDNSFQKASGVTADYSEFKRSGLRLVTKDSNVICLGAHGQGSLNAVYDFLKELFDYEYYEVNTYVLNRAHKVQLPDWDIKNIPDFDKVDFIDVSNYERYGGDVKTAWRQRLYVADEEYIVGGHTAEVIMPIDKWYAGHEDWFSSGPDDKGWQLCYSNMEMMQQYIENCKVLIQNDPDGLLFSFGERDINGYCTCANCQNLMASYNLYDETTGELIMAAPSSVPAVLFKTQVADALDAWLAEEYPGRHLTYPCHAYFSTRTPPVYYNATTQKFTLLTNGEPDDPMKNINPNIQFELAAIETNRNLSWEDNKSQGIEIRKWSVVTPNMKIYDYPQDAANTLLPYDGIHTHADNMRFVHALGHREYLYQGNSGTQSSGFNDLRKYVVSKLAWDIDVDPNAVAEDYLRVTCGPAYEYMSELYKIERTRVAKLREENNYGGHVLQNGLTTGNWPRDLIVVMENLTLKAYEAIDYLKYENPEMYERYFRRIKIEQLMMQYVNLCLYRGYYSKDNKNALIDEFLEYSTKYNAKLYHESKPMSDLVEGWRKD